VSARPFAVAAIALSLFAGGIDAQESVRVNLASTFTGIPGIAVDWRVAPRVTRQLDVTLSPWISRNGFPAAFLLVLGEQRWHAQPGGEGFYLGAHLGLSVFRFQKPNRIGRNFYEEGVGVVGGGTLGYEHRLGARTSVDLYFGGGTVQVKYKSYFIETGERADEEAGWNESGELVPYRVGFVVAYRLGGR
jgi:hypothetical protein